jgi:hypothetical protein
MLLRNAMFNPIAQELSSDTVGTEAGNGSVRIAAASKKMHGQNLCIFFSIFSLNSPLLVNLSNRYPPIDILLIDCLTCLLLPYL